MKKLNKRDFNHEEKGEEIDDLEPKMEEKEKVTKPRGWNKDTASSGALGGSSSGKDDSLHKPKKENPKKKKQNLEKNGKNPKLPTADGSRQSRLDKENAEKEVANKNMLRTVVTVFYDFWSYLASMDLFLGRDFF